MNRVAKIFHAAIAPFGILLIWEIWARIAIDSTRTLVLPPPTRILQVMFETLGQLPWWEMAGRTFGVTALGFALGSVCAIVLGIALGQSSFLARLINPSLLGLRSLPVVLYVPVALVLFNAGLQVPVALAAVVTTLYCAPPVARAVAEFDPEKRQFLHARGRTGVSFYIGFVLPEIISALYLSLSLAVTLALAVTVVAEILLPSLDGLGTAIYRAREMNQYTRLWAMTGLLAIGGLLFHNMVLGLWRFAAPWLRNQREK